MIDSSGSFQVPAGSLLVQPIVVKGTFLGLCIATWGWVMKVPSDREHLFWLFSNPVSALLTLSLLVPLGEESFYLGHFLCFVLGVLRIIL